MGESQSRYGIMESLNSKKIEAQSRLSSIEAEMEQQEIAFGNTVDKLDIEISNEASNYETKHKNWVKNRMYELNKKKAQFEVDQKLAVQAHDRNVEELERQMKDRENSYVGTHEEFAAEKTTEKATNQKQYDNWKKMKTFSKGAIDKEITGYNAALTDLKEVSKESTKAD